METHKLLPEKVAYIGDDLNDLPCIEYCGLTAAPQDAIAKNVVDYVCEHPGGHGAVREFVDYIIFSIVPVYR